VTRILDRFRSHYAFDSVPTWKTCASYWSQEDKHEGVGSWMKATFLEERNLVAHIRD